MLSFYGPLHNYETLEGGLVGSLKVLRNVAWVGVSLTLRNTCKNRFTNVLKSYS